MAHIISDLSKYVILFFMGIYIISAFIALCRNNEDDRNGIYSVQIVSMFMVHFLGFSAICLETGDVSYIIFYGFQQILLFATIALFRVIYPKINKLIINNMCMLLTIGFVILTRISYDKSMKQFKIVAGSLIIGLFIPFLVKKLRFLKYLTILYGAIGMIALSIVLILGARTYGAKISYSILGFTFQPSEFVKIIFVFCIAGMLKESTKFTHILLTAIVAGIHVLILVFSKDLGSGVIFFFVYLTMIFVATKNYFYLLVGMAGGAGACYVGYLLFDHVKERIVAWLDPWNNINDKGYHITQSLFAIGTGGWFGMGIYQGDPTSIPFVEQDSVFSAVAEELGVLFAMGTILLCLTCFLAFMKIAMELKDDFYRYIAVGLGSTYMFQVFLTIGGGTRFIPLTGVTLPFISYGGSSVLSTCLLFCIIQGLSLTGEEPKKKKKRKAVNEEAIERI